MSSRERSRTLRCEGLDVDLEGTVDGRFQVDDRGPGGFDFLVEKTTVVQVFTDRQC